MKDDLGKLNYASETQKYLALTTPYCKGCGLDIASQGSPVVPWAWQLDLPPDEFAHYNAGGSPRGPIQLRGHAHQLPVETGSLDFCYSSHLLEDFPIEQWEQILNEWVRVLKVGGHLIVIVPDIELWNAAIARGQSPNCSHRHESKAGELSTFAERLGLSVIEDRLTALWPEDYSVLFVAVKVR